MDYFPVEQYRTATMECVLASSVRQQVPANVLLALIEIEGGKEGTVKKNKNGSLDFGRVQINSTHLDELSSYGVPRATAAYYLTNDGCYNVEMAAFLLKRHLSSDRDSDFWIRVANYHSKTPSVNAQYRKRFQLREKAMRWADWLGKRFNTKDYPT